MNLPFVWSSAVKDLKRRLRDPWALVFWLGMPLVIVSLMLLAFGGQDGRTPTARVLVVDQDSTFVSSLFVQALGRSPVIEAETFADTVEGRKRLEDGKATAMLTLPKGFGAAVLADSTTTVAVLTNPSQRFLPGIVVESLTILTDVAFYVQRLFGEEVRTFTEGPPPGAAKFPQSVVDRTGASINDKMGRVSAYVFPPRIQLETVVETTSEGPEPGLGELFFPGVLFMALLFMASGMASDVWVEKEKGTLRRALSTPRRIRDFFAGKVLAGASLMGGTSVLGLLVGSLSFGIPLSRIPLAAVWSTFAGTVFLILITLIYLHASSARTAGVLTTMIIFPLLMVGGSFFPLETMPRMLATVGGFTPNGWALMQFKNILWGGGDPLSLGTAFLGLAVVTVAGFTLGELRFGRGFAVS